MTPTIWNCRLELLAASFHANRAAFDYASESYSCWAWLALEAGSFWFGIGRGNALVEGQCDAGDWVLCPPGEPLQRRMLTPGSYHFARFQAPEEALWELRGRGTLRDSPRLRANFAGLREAGRQLQNGEWKAHLLHDTLCRAWWERENAASGLTDAAMQEPLRWIEANFARRVSLEGLAKSVHLTPSSFSRRFRAAVGVSPQEFLLQKRLDAARTELLETDATLDAIAARCGFASGFYLSRLWTKRFGVPPARFRRLHRV